MDRLLTADRDDRRDGELEDPSIEIVQSEEQREGRLQNEEPQVACGTMAKGPFMSNGSPRKKGEKGWGRKTPKEMMAKCPQFSEIYKCTD